MKVFGFTQTHAKKPNFMHSGSGYTYIRMYSCDGILMCSTKAYYGEESDA